MKNMKKVDEYFLQRYIINPDKAEWQFHVKTAKLINELVKRKTFIEALGNVSYMILEMDKILHDDTEIEDEDCIFEETLCDKLVRAKKSEKFSNWRYELNGEKGTRAYYCVDGDHKHDSQTNQHLIITLFRQYLWKHDKTVYSDSYYDKKVLPFIEYVLVNVAKKYSGQLG